MTISILNNIKFSVVFFLIFFLSSQEASAGFLFFGNKEPDPGKKQTIAILPVDKSVQRPLTTNIDEKLGQSFLDKGLGRLSNVKFLNSGKTSRDPEYVKKRIYVVLGRTLRRRKYEIADPVRVFAAFNTLAYRSDEVLLDSLYKRVPADAYLFVTITQWDTDEFDRTGIMYTSYVAQLIDGKNKKMIWEKTRENKRFLVRQNQNDIGSYTAFYDELIDLIALDMLKKFPKKLPVSSDKTAQNSGEPFEVPAEKVTS